LEGIVDFVLVKQGNGNCSLSLVIILSTTFLPIPPNPRLLNREIRIIILHQSIAYNFQVHFNIIMLLHSLLVKGTTLSQLSSIFVMMQSKKRKQRFLSSFPKWIGAQRNDNLNERSSVNRHRS
jgi:hypothetical protein